MPEVYVAFGIRLLFRNFRLPRLHQPVTMATERSTAAKEHSCKISTGFFRKFVKSSINLKLYQSSEKFDVVVRSLRDVAFEIFDLGKE